MPRDQMAKIQNRSSVVTNSMKISKMVHIKKKKKTLENKRNEVSQVPKAIGNGGCVEAGQTLFGLKRQILFGLKSHILFGLMMVLLSNKKLYNLVECK